MPKADPAKGGGTLPTLKVFSISYGGHLWYESYGSYQCPLDAKGEVKNVGYTLD